MNNKAHMTKADIFGEVRNYSTLKPGWDSYRSPVPSKESIDSAITFLQAVNERLLGLMEISPSLDGGVEMAYDNGARWVSILSNQDGTYTVETSDEREWIRTKEFEEVMEQFDWATET